MECIDVSGLPAHRSFAEQTEGLCHEMDLSEGWRVTCRKPDGEVVDTDKSGCALTPVSSRLPAFSGTICYEKDIFLDQECGRAVFCAEHIGEVCRLKVNGIPAGIRLTPPYQFELKELLKKGGNTLMIEVASTPARDQVNYPMAPFDFTYEAVEATGMYGNIQLLYKQAE
jgi:hypothetical protein